MTAPVYSAAAATTSVVVASRFVIQITGSTAGSALQGSQGEIAFSELAGINSEVEPAEYFSSSTSGVNLSKQFGKAKPATVTLKRGMDNNTLLWTWHQMVLDGDPTARTSASLILLDTMGVNKASYQLINAWPSKIEIGGMKAGASEVVITTATLVCDQIQLGTAQNTTPKA
jgi:phage tail-like protein